MSIGFGIFMFALGAILAFAVNVSLGWIELSTVGYILMIRRRSISTSHTTVDPATGDRVTRHEDIA